MKTPLFWITCLCDYHAMTAKRCMRKWLFTRLGCLALLIVCVAGAATAEPRTGNLIIEVTQLPAEGVLFLELFQAQGLEHWSGEPMRRLRLPASREQMHLELEALPFGTYAIRVFLDENGNGILDTTSKGLPKEAFGFSKNKMGKHGISTPSKAAFIFDAADPTTAIQLRSRKRKAEPPASEGERPKQDKVE